MQLPRPSSWAAAALFFAAAAAFADPRPLPDRAAKVPPDFAAALQEEWTELRVGIDSPRFGRRLGLTIQRFSTPLSLRFTMQASVAQVAGAKAGISYEQVTGALKDLLRHYENAVAERIPIEFAQKLAKDANSTRRWPVAVLSIELLAPRGNVSGSVAVQNGLPTICKLLASLAEVDKAPRNPGIPPQDVAALLRSDWTELRVGAAVDPGCMGLRDFGVIITKIETGLRVQPFSDLGLGKAVNPPVELPATDWPKLEAEVLKHYQKAYGEYAGAEQSIGWEVAGELTSALFPVAIGGLQPSEMFVQVKTKDRTKRIRNCITDFQDLAWTDQLGRSR